MILAILLTLEEQIDLLGEEPACSVLAAGLSPFIHLKPLKARFNGAAISQDF